MERNINKMNEIVEEEYTNDNDKEEMTDEDEDFNPLDCPPERVRKTDLCVETSRDLLSEAALLISGAIGSDMPDKILTNMYMKAEKNKLILSATNMEIATTVSINAHVEQEGEVMVNLEKFRALLQKFPKKELKVKVDKKMAVCISYGRSEFKLFGNDPKEYPVDFLQSIVPYRLRKEDNSEHLTTMHVPAWHMRQGIAMTEYACEKREKNVVLAGIYVATGKNGLEINGTNGTILSYYNVPDCCITESGKSVVIPVKAANELQKIINDIPDNEILEITVFKKDKIKIKTNDIVFTASLIGYEYPKFQACIPVEEFSFTASISRSELIRSLERVGIVANSKTKCVGLFFNEIGELSIKSESDIGSGVEKLDLDQYDGDDCQVWVNSLHLIQVLGRMGELKCKDVITIKLGKSGRIKITGLNPLVFLPEYDKNPPSKYLCLVMPMNGRVASEYEQKK